MPQSYFAIIDHVKLKHLPDDFFDYIRIEGKGKERLVSGIGFEYRIDKYNIYDYEKKLVRVDTKFNIYCADAKALPTNVIWPGVDKADIVANYHCITIKIYPNNIIKSWDVGGCIENDRVVNVEDQYVKLGKFGKHRCTK